MLNCDIPENWYECSEGACEGERGARYQFPLPEVENAPVPSQANYERENVAWLIEFLADMLGRDKTAVEFRYENNTPNNKDDDIFVRHPNDKEYLPEVAKCRPKSEELKRYEEAAKKSQILKCYEENSPAEITYFQDQCPEE